MRSKKSKSDEVANPFTYRITSSDRLSIEVEHGSLTKFLNDSVEKELKKIKKKERTKK